MKHYIPDILSNGIVLDDDLSKANAFNNFFGSVFTNDDGNLPLVETKNEHSSDICITYDVDSIIYVLNELKPSLSVGPDGLCEKKKKIACN